MDDQLISMNNCAIILLKQFQAIEHDSQVIPR